MSQKVLLPLVAVIALVVIIGGAIVLNQNNQQATAGNQTTSSTTSKATTTGSNQTGITLATVAQHASRTDCWLVIEAKVYNVTSFIPSHPGGAEILKGCGKDATAMFAREGHSSNARSMMANYYIGDLIQ